MNEREIFDAALALGAPTEQEAFLEVACGDDTAQFRRLQELLEAQRRLGSFLESPPAAAIPTIDQPLAEKPGTLIGPYKLLQQIGEGGMGVVYMAEQHEPVKRRVALKIIKPGMDTRQVIARFEAERQALSLMDHPNIAKVLDAGTTNSGRPYFVMELVKGQPITQYCDEKHLTPRQRLELLLPVCQAIQHAHQKGIIHRDIKPTNILVAEYDQQPVPKVIDFGVAKATSQTLTEKTMFTGLGQIVGTLEYMSPEQAKVNQLDIDTRSDIYSLGVLLYELLTGSTPFDKQRLRSAAFDEMLRIIREEEPPKPSTKLSESKDSLPSISAQRQTEPAKLTKLVRGELDWIVMKALEKDRNRRYETASAFAADLQHYLSDEPVVACPPSATYRFRKFARRNKARLVAATVLAVALLIAVSGVGWAVRDRVAREAEIVQERTNREAKLAGQIETILNEVDGLEHDQKWPEALAAARRAEAAVAVGEADAATTGRVRQRLKELEFIDRLEQIRLEHTAKTDQEYGRAFRDYGVDIENLAVETSIECLKTRPALALALAATLDDWVSLRNPGTPQIEVAGWKQLVAIARGIDPEPLRDLLRSMWGRPRSDTQDELRRLADSINVRAQHPVTLSQLALTLSAAGLRDPAVRILREAQLVYPGDHRLNYLLAIHADGDEKIRFYTAALAARPSSLALYVTLGMGLEELDGKLDEAAAVYRRLIEIDPKGHFGNQGYLGITRILCLQAKPDEAIAVYRKAIAAVPEAHYETSYLLGIGEILQEQKKLNEAIAVYRRVIELNPRSQLEGLAYYYIGNALRDQENLPEAIDAYRKAVELFPADHRSYIELGKALPSQGKLGEAVTAYRKAIELDPKDAIAHNNLGLLLYSDLKDYNRAIEYFRKAAELDPKFANAYGNLGVALRDQGKVDEAIAACRKAIELDPKSAGAHNNLGALLCDGQRDYVKAIECFRKAIELDPKHANAYGNLGNALHFQGKLDEAIAALRKAIELDPKNANAYHILGSTLTIQKKWDETIAAYKKALAIDPQHANANNGFAWMLATCPDPKFRDPALAVTLAKKAIDLNPKNWAYANTLGAASYRAGDWNGAIAALEKSMELRQGGDSNDWFFLAMAHWQLGEKDKAREWNDKAVQWMEANAKANEELIRFRAEAEELMKKE